MRIGELAELSGVAAKNIRYYEGIGLMPAPPRTGGGYRDYGDDAVGRLSFIRAAQSIGLSLGEVREVLAFRDRGEVPCAHVASLIERRAADLSHRIGALERMRRDLERLAKTARRVSRSDAQGATYCHIIERAEVRPEGSGAPTDPTRARASTGPQGA